MIDKLLVKQVPSLLEAFTGWETNNKYEIQNSAGQRVYFAAEGILNVIKTNLTIF